jgi:hypothetical protein
MITWLREDFTVNVTQDDINTCNRGVWWDDPIRRAIMRQFRISYPADVRVGWGYLDIYFEEETDKFDVVERKACEEYLRAFARGDTMQPATFNVRVNQIQRKKAVSDKVPARYSKVPPKIAKLGL